MGVLLTLSIVLSLTQANYLEEFLVTKDDIYEVACSDHPYKTSFIQEALCSNTSINTNHVIYCTIQYSKSEYIIFMLKLKLSNSSDTEVFRCKFGKHEDYLKIPYLCDLIGNLSTHLIILEHEDNTHKMQSNRNLLTTCSATLKFNIVGAYSYKAYLAILDSCVPDSPACGLNVNDYLSSSIPFTLSDGGATITATFTAENINSKIFAVVINANGAKIEFYQNAALSGLPSHIKYQNTNYCTSIPNADYPQYNSSMKVSGIIKSFLSGDIQIGFHGDNYGTLNLYGSLDDSIYSKFSNVYKTFTLALGQEIPFKSQVFNTNHGFCHRIFYKGSDGVERIMNSDNTYYFGVTTFSPWIFENYYPKMNIPSYETLTFHSITYNDCNQIYKELAGKNMVWPQLCSSVYLTATSISCLNCVYGSTYEGSSCVCDNHGAIYHPNFLNNSCVITIPISVKLYKLELSSVSPAILVISDSCTISDALECIQDNTRTYLYKTKHILFQNNIEHMEGDDFINPEGAYTIFINTLNAGGLNIKCYNNLSLSGSPFYEATDFIGVYNMNSIEVLHQPSSCIIYGYYKIDISGEYTFYIKGYDEVSTFIDDSNITSFSDSGSETQYTATFTAPVYIPIRILVRNSSSQASVNIQISRSGSDRIYLDKEYAFNTNRMLDKIWDIDKSNINLYLLDNKIEMSIILCNTLCISCEIGLNGVSSCLRCIENASAIESDCICDDEYEYSSEFNLCIKTINLCPNNCSECINDTTCILCEARFYLDTQSNTCRSCPDHCITCEYNECTECDRGFMMKDFECICEYGHIYSVNQSTCIRLPDFCAYYDIDTGRCLECLDTFELENDMCSCKEGYYSFIPDQIEVCIACPDLCKECLDAYECLICVEYAELKDGKCECSKGFRKDNGVCIEDLFIVDVELDQDRSIILSFNKELSSSLTSDSLSIRANSTIYSSSYFNVSPIVEYKSYMLTLSDMLPQGNMTLTILFSDTISSVEGSTLSNLLSTITIQLASIPTVPPAFEEREKIIRSVSSGSSYSAVISNTISGVLSMNPNLIISYINTVKIIYYIKHMNVNIPLEVRTEQDTSNKIIESLNVLSHFNMDWYLETKSENTYSFISTSISQIFILLLIIICDLMLCILNIFASGKFKDKIVKVRGLFKYNIYIQYLFINYLDFSHTALSRLEQVIKI